MMNNDLAEVGLVVKPSQQTRHALHVTYLYMHRLLCKNSQYYFNSLNIYFKIIVEQCLAAKFSVRV